LITVLKETETNSCIGFLSDYQAAHPNDNTKQIVNVEWVLNVLDSPITLATPAKNGLMSAADKSKLNGIQVSTLVGTSTSDDIEIWRSSPAPTG
jgi:hypothetical protein